MSSDNYLVPSIYSRLVAQELRLQEQSLSYLLKGTGLPKEILLPGNKTLISGAQQARIFENAAQIKPIPEMGLLIGSRLQPSVHGPLGYLALSSPDLRTSLESLRDFVPARITFLDWEVELSGEWLICTLRIKQEMRPKEQLLLQESSALVIQSFAESVLGRDLTEARIEMDHPAPPYHELYKNYFHSPVSFNRPECRVKIPIELSDYPNAMGDASAFLLAYDLCCRLKKQAVSTGFPTTDRVRRILLSKPLGKVTEQEVAQIMYISKRTLARRLEEEGSSYRETRERLLSQMSEQYLCETNKTVEDVASLLGYNDSSAFRKAFRRWQGMSPSEFRSQQVSAEAFA